MNHTELRARSETLLLALDVAAEVALSPATWVRIETEGRAVYVALLEWEEEPPQTWTPVTAAPASRSGTPKERCVTGFLHTPPRRARGQEQDQRILAALDAMHAECPEAHGFGFEKLRARSGMGAPTLRNRLNWLTRDGGPVEHFKATGYRRAPAWESNFTQYSGEPHP